jgi:hypothetical protein
MSNGLKTSQICLPGQPNRELIQKLLDASNQITKSSIRGSGNYMLVNSNLASYFSSILSIRTSLRIEKIEKMTAIINETN